jgi:hypothetical protein
MDCAPPGWRAARSGSSRCCKGHVEDRDPETGQFLEGREKTGGRQKGTPNKWPDNYIHAMRELIAGRIKELIGNEKDSVAISQSIAPFHFDAELYAGLPDVAQQ